MAYSIGSNTCENDPTHETCEMCGHCQECFEFDDASSLNKNEVMNIFNSTLSHKLKSGALSEDTKNELLAIFKESLDKKTEINFTIGELPITPFYSYFYEYIKRFVGKKNVDDIENKARTFILSHCYKSKDAIDKFYYVDDPSFTNDLNSHCNESLLVALLCVHKKAERETLIEFLFTTINEPKLSAPGFHKFLSEKFNN